MTRTDLLRRLPLALAVILAVAGCSCPQNDRQPTSPRTVKLAGASTVYPLVLACADEYHARNRHACVAVAVCGTRGGFERFCAGTTDVATASRPINFREIDEAARRGVAFIELPIAFDPLTVVVNPKNCWVDHLTTDELARMWCRSSQGRVTRWSQVRAGWPDKPLHLYGPGTDSGTFDYFTEAVNGKAGDCRTDYSASEDDNILVRGVAGDRYAMGYFGHVYYEQHRDKLRAVKIKGPKNKEPVEPGYEGVKDGTYSPLSRPLFLYVNKASADRPEVDRFVTFMLDNAPALARRKAYTALPKEANAAVRDRYQQRRAGTAFAGAPEVGLTMADVLHRELQ